MRSSFITQATVGALLFMAPLHAGEPVTIASGNAAEAPRQPQTAVAADGTIHLVYGIDDAIYHTQSTSQGRNFSTPQKAFECPNLSLGMRRGPRVAASGTSVVVTAIGGLAGKGRDGDLLAWRRLPMGVWAGPVRVNDVADAAREGLHAMASGSDGAIWCCWLDLRNRRTEVCAARSTDGGETWSKNLLVYHSPSGSVCECCHPSIAVGPDGRAHVLFRNSIEGRRDMYLASSRPDGTFAEAAKLGEGTWELNRCPMDGGMLAVDAIGKIFTSWRRKEEVFLATGSSEQRLGRGEQPWLAAMKDGPLAVWTEKSDSKLFLLRAGSNTPELLADRGRDPVIVRLTDGKTAFVCWEAVVDKQRTIMGQVID